MDIRKLQRVIVDAIIDVKGRDIVVYNTEKNTDQFTRVIVATGTSNRHTAAIADNVKAEVKKAGGSVAGVEGRDTGDWVLVDCGQAVVHIMQPKIRSYYRLEELWGPKRSRIRIEPEYALPGERDASRGSPENEA